MDNISQAKNEEEVVIPQEGADIQFDETIDIDKIQRELQIQLGELPPEEKTPDSTEIAVTEAKEIQMPPVEPVMEINPQAKKYVIYIDPENVNFMESLSINERKLVINRILMEEDASVAKQKKIEARRKHTINVIIATLTVVIGLPVMFYAVNNSLIVTMKNYQQAKENFSKLYREHGKIQPQNNN